MASADVPMTDALAKTIDATPQAGQQISHAGKEYTTIKEGLAHILVPQGVPTSTDPKLSKEDTQKQQVFYNPIQQFNRDLSVLAIKTFGQDSIQRKSKKHEQFKERNARKKQRMQASRAAKDVADGSNDVTEVNQTAAVPGVEEVTSKKRKLDDVEMEDDAAPPKKQRVTENGEKEAEDEVDINGGRTPWKPAFSILDALSATGLRALRFCDKKGYDVIDLDPYGTAAPFIDAAIQAINDDGMLCVTCTDSAIFASHGYLEKTYSQYGGLPFKGEPCHEGGLRLILHAIASSAARYGMAIEPLLSLSIDYYIRVFVRVRKAPNDVKLLAGKTMLVYHCESGCGAWSTQFLARNKVTKNKNGDPMYKHGFAQGPSADQHCEHCGHKTHLSGPMYGGPLHNVGFIERVLAQLNDVDRETYPTMDRIQGMLHTALEEITFGTKLEKSNGAQQTQVLDALIPKSDPAEIDHHPFFFIPSSVAKVVHCSAPPLAALRGALRHAGFKVTMSHCKPGSIKTDASWSDIWHIMLEWVRQRAPLKNALKTGSPGHAIMAKASASGHTRTTAAAEPAQVPVDPATEAQGTGESATATAKDLPAYLNTKYYVNFDEKLGKDHDRGKYVRYQLAPRENWGPMSRAK
ncbi:N2,N2-dimethylguanosine tRNA methyltransferase [Pyrenophora tritici-repentis Pt-1C-BFP]|uniref:tRNA (guanine(26)-N(2))-dimethyltransferase n=1 Tax=Pyrenophora tritici-repentis (strain Pt-1C-BFP) TaxID=426418 RepID=B2WEH7_PYRTR|nr:N2,N2-dimethylguanosine tRNA methyltransferase [Pyrenophora tritici-repentis Pt-1C-BFP]EDU51469.1 N2,N2-dimethylguanosine tRNA methyltransferase [Pyrenophora tritici-repentis Pt-1C-BFP]